MPDLDDIDEAIDAAIAGPKVSEADGFKQESHSLKDLDELRKRRAADTQLASSGRLIFNKISPPGAV